MADEPEDYQPTGENVYEEDRSQRENPSSYYPLNGPAQPEGHTTSHFRCAHCGTALTAAGRFCGSCGAPCHETPSVEPLAPQQGVFNNPTERGPQQPQQDGYQQHPAGWERQPPKDYGRPPQPEAVQSATTIPGSLRSAFFSVPINVRWLVGGLTVFLVAIILNALTAGSGGSPSRDDRYLASLQNSGISYTNQAATIQVGHQICTYFDHGNTFPAVLNEVSITYPDLTSYEDGIVIGAAVAAYCSYNKSSIPGQ